MRNTLIVNAIDSYSHNRMNGGSGRHLPSSPLSTFRPNHCPFRTGFRFSGRSGKIRWFDEGASATKSSQPFDSCGFMTKRPNKVRYVRIEGAQVELGMYVHTLHCSWLNSPFWRKSFLLTDLEDRAKIQDSVPHVTIDLTKGCGLKEPKAGNMGERTDPPAVEASPSPVPTSAPTKVRRRKSPTEWELVGIVAERATAAVSRLYGEARLGRVIYAADLVPIVEEIAQTISKGSAAMVAVTRLRDRDHYTYIHSVAVATLMMGLARHLRWSEEDVRVAGMAGLLHDIGKMQVAAGIVEKPGRLDPEELAQMRQHPGIGHSILLDMEGLDPRILDVCRHHHERIDGAGYPDGLKGDELSPLVRLSAVCDVYDAVTSIRPYKRAWSPHEALAQMLEWDGHFDMEMVHALIASLGIQPLGALVRLTSNRLGIVVREGESPTKPVVRTFFDVPEQRILPAEEVATAHDAILRVERGEYWFGTHWPALQAEIMAQTEMPAPPHHRLAG
jgi:putative nucleotidyltransferase with HDIG domain